MTKAKAKTKPRKKRQADNEPIVEVRPEREWADFDDNDGILEEAKRIFAANISNNDEDRTQARDDMDFIEQPWTEEALAQRDGKACLNADPLAQFRNKVKNEFSKLRPAIKVRPFDSYADVKTAAKLAGLVRHVEDISRAQRVYCHAQGQMVDSGQGWFRVTYDYCNEESFEQDIYIRKIMNRFCVVPGYFEEADASDMVTCFVTDSVPRADYADTVAAGHEWDLDDANLKYWHDDDNITLAEYWRKITKPDTLVKLSNGMTTFKSVMDEPDFKAAFEANNAKLKAESKPQIRIIKRRDTERPYVQCFKLTAFDVLEKQEWPGRYIPLIPMLGNVLVRADGTVITYGMVRFSRDQVRMINYAWSEEMEMGALQPKVPFVGTAEQFAGHEDEWDAVASGRSSRTTYNPHVVDGVLIPAPQRQQPPQIAAAMIQSRVGAMELLKGAQGVYASGLGDQGPEQSGRAILAQKSNSDTATFHYIDGPAISIQHCARIIIDLARKVISGPTMRRILGEDGSEEMQQFNAPVLDGEGNEKLGADGKPELYDLNVGEYDVAVEMGPAYATQRQEALAALTDVLKVLPPERAAMIADLVVANIDAKDMDKAAARLKAMVPPEILKAEQAEDGGGDPEDKAAALQQQVDALTQQMEQLQAAGAQVTEEMAKYKKLADDKAAQLEFDKWKALLESEVKLKIEEMGTKRAVILERMRGNQKASAAAPQAKKPKAPKKNPKSEANSGDGEPAA